MLTAAELARLAAARGDAFDRLFLTYMIRHHEGALTMVGRLLATPGAAHEPETFGFASDVDADQRAEIARMRALLRPAAPPPTFPSRPLMRFAPTCLALGLVAAAAAAAGAQSDSAGRAPPARAPPAPRPAPTRAWDSAPAWPTPSPPRAASSSSPTARAPRASSTPATPATSATPTATSPSAARSSSRAATTACRCGTWPTRPTPCSAPRSCAPGARAT
jgi:hypothetical protein